MDDSYLRYQDTEVNPKFGLQWSVYDWLRIRAAIFRTVKRPLIVYQTIEPTQIAGFNQLYDYENGTRATQRSFGVDVNVTKELLVGVEYSDRDLEVPTRQDSGPPSFTNQDEASLNSFVYWTPHQNWALSAEVFRETIEAPGLKFREVNTLSFPFTARYYHQSGFFAQLGATFVRQSVDPAPVGTSTTRDEFSVIDAAIGYRLPDRRGIISLEVRNLLGEEFLYTDYDYITNVPATSGSRFIPDRSILGRITISF
jgi:outer membrane receptor protein involved in Fe transport